MKSLSLLSGKRNIAEQRYNVFDSITEAGNVGLQLLLAVLTDVVFKFGTKHPPFAFPEGLTLKEILQVPRPSESLHETEVETK